MIIAAISDLHGYLPDPPPWPYDIVIIAGDIMPDKRPIEKQAEWLDKVWTDWLISLDAPAYWTWGNHDFAAERLLVSPEWKGLVDQALTIEGIKFYFTPWVPNLGRWAYSFAGDVPDEKRAEIPADTDILVTHGPPYGIGDRTIYENEHVGSTSLAVYCDQIIHPPLVICGHIHEGRGCYETQWADMSMGTIYNVAALDRNYRPREHPWVQIDTAMFRLPR